MAKGLTPLGIFIKWALIPIALGGIGYYFLGPRIGGPLAQKAANRIKLAQEKGELPPTIERVVPEPKVIAGPTGSPTPAPELPGSTETGDRVRERSSGPEISVSVREEASSTRTEEDRPDSNVTAAEKRAETRAERRRRERERREERERQRELAKQKEREKAREPLDPASGGGTPPPDPTPPPIDPASGGGF